MSMFALEMQEENLVQRADTHRASFRLDIETNNKQDVFRNKKALLFISVGQLYHEQGKFMATVELVNKYAFSRCDIVMADTLQRFNHYGRMSESDALVYTKNEGDKWLYRNANALKKIQFEHEILRWDEFLFHPDYDDLKKTVLQEYHNNEEYKAAIHANVETYIERLQKINPGCSVDTVFEFGVSYLIEECPIVMPLWARMGYDFIIYPKPLTIGMRATRKLFVEPVDGNKCQWIYLRFKKR